MPRRRGSIALAMLDQSVAPSLNSVLSNVIPPSEDATLQVVDNLVTAAVWENHLHTLDQIARICGADQAATEAMLALATTNEFLGKDEGHCGLRLTDLKDDEPLPVDIDVRARGRIGTHAQSISPAAAAAAAAAACFSDFDETSDVPSCASLVVSDPNKKASAFSSLEAKQSFAQKSSGSLHAQALAVPAPAVAALAVTGAPVGGGGDRGPAGQGGGASLDDVPLLTALTVRTSPGVRPMTPATRASLSAGRVRGSLSRGSSYTHGQISSRSEVSSASSRAKSSVSPAMAALFFMADRRGVGWLTVTDIQVFLEYHGQKKWASASRIRSVLTELGISKTGNDPIKQHHFARFLLNLIQRDPLMDFSSRPLPPDESLAGIEYQARELAAILKEAEDRHRNRVKPTMAKRRLNRALTSTSAAQAFGKGSGGGGGIEAVGEEGEHDGASGHGRDQASHQVALEVAIRDLAAARRRSTAPVLKDSRRHRQSDSGRKARGGGAGGGGAGGRGRRGVRLPLSSSGAVVSRGGKGLEAFFSSDHSVQASLVEADIDIRPGVTVQESGLPNGRGSRGSRSMPEVLRSKSGPVAMPVPGRLSRTAYKALSRTSTAPELPVGSEAAKTTAGVVGQGDSAKHPLRDEIGRMPGGAGRGANGGRPSTAPVGLHGYLRKNDEADPRLLGGSKVSIEFDGGDAQPGYSHGIDGGSSHRPSTSTSQQRHPSPGLRAGVIAVGAVDSDPDDLPPFFVGEEAGRSSPFGGIGGQGSAPHALIPRGARRASSARGASRAKVSSPGLGVRRDRRGGGARAVAAW